jgi:hypothetical protein
MPQRPAWPSTLGRLSLELPPRLRCVIDTSEFATLARPDRMAVERLADALDAHVVTYPRASGGSRLPLCTVIGQAWLGWEELSALRAVEAALPPEVVLVAYERPVQLRHPEETLIRAARYLQPRRDGTGLGRRSRLDRCVRPS